MRLVKQKSMNWEEDYLDLVSSAIHDGEPRNDRTGVGTRALFGRSLTIDLRQGFPAITTKSLAWKAVVSELLWFIEGSGDERRLAEILHGTRDLSKKTIWSPNAESTTGSKYQPKFYGDLGRIYGVQWRSFQSATIIGTNDVYTVSGDVKTYRDVGVQIKTTDQLSDLINRLKTNPTDRRLILSAWNPGELDQMALPPCHMFAQFYLTNDGRLDCQMYQRSVDLGLGLPFNIASYALLTHLVARAVGAHAGILNMVLGDTHVYSNHIEALSLQIQKNALPIPKLLFNTENTDIDGYKMGDFELEGYRNYGHLALEMAA